MRPGQRLLQEEPLGLDILQARGVPLDRQNFSWRDRIRIPISQLNDDALSPRDAGLADQGWDHGGSQTGPPVEVLASRGDLADPRGPHKSARILPSSAPGRCGSCRRALSRDGGRHRLTGSRWDQPEGLGAACIERCNVSSAHSGTAAPVRTCTPGGCIAGIEDTACRIGKRAACDRCRDRPGTSSWVPAWF